MTDIILFDFESSKIRTGELDGKPVFCLSDLLTALNSKTTIGDAKLAISDVFGEGYVINLPLETTTGIQCAVFVFESGLTFLISRSRTEKGKRMNRWIHSVVLPSIRKTGSYSIAPEIPRQLPPVRDVLDYAHAMPIINALTNTRLKELLLNKMTDELSLLETQKQLPAKTARYTIAKVRATELGYSLSQIGSGSALGTHIGKQVDRVALGAFQEGVGNYNPWHYPVCIDLDMAIHSYFRIKGLEPDSEPKVLCDYR